MTLHALLLAVVESLRLAMPGLDIQTHPGAFDLAERQRIGAVYPTVRVALMEAPEIEARNHTAIRCTFQATVLCKLVPGVSALERSLAIVQSLLIALNQAEPAAALASRPEQIRAVNGYNPRLDAAGYALWTVTWQQVLQPDKTLGLSDLADFRELYVQYDADGERTDETPEPSDSIKPPQ